VFWIRLKDDTQELVNGRRQQRNLQGYAKFTKTTERTVQPLADIRSFFPIRGRFFTSICILASCNAERQEELFWRHEF
jgi:hypothetical protein